MVKLQPSKLITRVRFPPPAPEVHRQCGRSSMVERDLPKVDVEGSNPFARSSFSVSELIGHEHLGWFGEALAHKDELFLLSTKG